MLILKKPPLQHYMYFNIVFGEKGLLTSKEVASGSSFLWCPKDVQVCMTMIVELNTSHLAYSILRIGHGLKVHVQHLKTRVF